MKKCPIKTHSEAANDKWQMAQPTPPNLMVPPRLTSAFCRLFCVLCFVIFGCGEGTKEPNLVRALEPEFTGVERCAECHTDSYAEWKHSLHSLAMAVPTDSTVVGDFNNASHTYGGVTSTMYQRDGKYYMKTPNANGQVQEFQIDYTIGVRQHQAYVTKFSDGRYQVLPLYHDGATNAWVDAQEGGVVAQHQVLKPNDYYYWTQAGRTWNFHCFDCHASRVQKHYDVDTDTYRSSVGNLSIDCEACHGPSAKHDETRGQPGAPMHLLALRSLDKEPSVEVCIQCHAAKEILTEGYLPGENFYDYYQLILPDDKRFFYPDGQPRVYIYPGALHLMSPCFVDDDLRCTTCHDSHGSTRDVDLVADREGVGLCEKCHEDIAENPVAHGHHKPGSKGNQCVQCHMPYHYVTGENLTDHRIVSPVPENTIVNGVPNSCNQTTCHADQSAQWASKWAKQWYGTYQDREVARTTVVALAQKGDVRAVDGLVKMLKDGSSVWRATAAGLLGGLDDGRVVPHLIQVMDDEHAMVRMKAAISLGRLGDMRAIPKLIAALSDSAKLVRIQAPFALMDLGYLDQTSDRFKNALSEHRGVVATVQSDDPGYHESLGQVYEQQGQFDAAEREFRIVAKLDPSHPETARDLDRVQKERDLFAKIISHFAAEELVLLRGAAQLQYGRYESAVDDLKKQTGISALFWTKLGDTYWGNGQHDEALQVYLQAVDVVPAFLPAVRQLAQMAFAVTGEENGDDAYDELPAQVWIDRALSAVRQKNWNDARKCFLAALEREQRGDISFGLSEKTRSVIRTMADSVFAVGGEAYEAGNLDAALSAYQKVLVLDPERADTHTLMGLIRADQGALAQAKQHLYDALLVNVSYVPALTILGTVFQDHENLDVALALYQLAWAIEPLAAGVELFMGQAYLMQGNRDSARVILSRVVKREPNNVEARELLNEAGGQEL
ncbi:MAG: ammonia-forming cytochrome c nitrite reductase subunit c552 [Candidatus Latescibacteria bacterium]|nr:ammonia-forming cytochrome c nitrite reductase subunit c552 [Candidatus Latescibacterota bacterium]MBT5829736.1 ammonia-forming cytochrome c nitrite reductase subunit c552 [Candidatus Latescibacterota bacterium]